MTEQDATVQFINTMEKFIGLACTRLPDDVLARLREMAEQEESPVQREIYQSYFENLDKAAALRRPSCQDTGLLHFYIKAGTKFPHLDMVADALSEATRRATHSVPLRPNAVNYFEERNTNDNTGERIPWINWDLVPGNDQLELTVFFAGAGCCLPGSSRVYKPSDGYAAIVRHVFDAVSGYGLNACPPLIVGVGLGHNVENAALLSKKAYLRPLSVRHHHPRGAKLEADLLRGLNSLGIGAQGLKGNQVAMAVNIESSGRHTATIACAVNTSCYMHRRGIIRFNHDLTYAMPTYKGATL